jgi:CRISPR/Cas system-associated endonuclease Cas3-HD
MRGWIFTVLSYVCLISAAVLAQDAGKLAPYYQQQRNVNADMVAQCSLVVADMQARINELEKQLGDAKKSEQ